MRHLEDKITRVNYPEGGWKKAYGINGLIIVVCKELASAAQEALSRLPFFRGEEVMQAARRLVKLVLSQYFRAFESSIVEVLENFVLPEPEKVTESSFKDLFKKQQEYSEDLLKPAGVAEAKDQMARIAVNIVNLLLVKLVSVPQNKAKIAEWERIIMLTAQMLKELFPELNLRLLQYYMKREL